MYNIPHTVKLLLESVINTCNYAQIYINDLHSLENEQI